MTARQLDHDALTELFNIGLHRAAASLSELTGQRIEVELPRLSRASWRRCIRSSWAA